MLGGMKAQPNGDGRVPDVSRSSSVKVLIMYEDLAAGNRAMRVFDSLVHHCGREVQLNSDMWKFDTLRSASICKMAAQDARDADVVIVSAHGSEELDDEVKAWFQEWARCRNDHPTALVALLDHTSGCVLDLNVCYTYIQRAAREGGMDFIAMTIDSEATDMPIRHAFSHEDDAPPTLEAFCRRIARMAIQREQAQSSTHS